MRITIDINNTENTCLVSTGTEDNSMIDTTNSTPSEFMKAIFKSGSQNTTQAEVKDINTDTSFASKDSARVEKKHLQTKSVDTFVSDDYYYIRIGNFFGRLTWNNHFTEIKSSCYYKNRKKAHHAIQ